MKLPQKENGYTAIANEIMEALAKIRIPGEARQMLDVIIRKTYGFNKKVDRIATSQFMEFTGLTRGVIHRARKRLLYTKLITVYKNDNSQILSYSFQKDYRKWVPVYKNVQCTKKSSNCIQKCNSTVPIIEGHKRHTTKDILQKTPAKIFTYLKDKVFNDMFNNYLSTRKKKATPYAKELILEDLHKHDISTAIAMLKQSIKNGWQGVFDLKEKGANYGKNGKYSEESARYEGIEKEV